MPSRRYHAELGPRPLVGAAGRLLALAEPRFSATAKAQNGANPTRSRFASDFGCNLPTCNADAITLHEQALAARERILGRQGRPTRD